MKRYFLRFGLVVSIFLVLVFLKSQNLFAAQVYLKNGDRVNGSVIEESKDNLILQTEAMGVVFLDREFIERFIDDTKKVNIDEPVEEKLWEGSISFGSGKSSGNTQNSQVSFGGSLNRKTNHDEFTLKGNSFYSSSNKKMDSQRWGGLARYAFSFGGQTKWYNFYKIEADHDRFANIDYRLTPAAGLGYWFSDQEDFKAMVEAGLGVEYTKFRDASDDSNELIIIPRAFLERKLMGNSRVFQDIILYPSLEDTQSYRLRAETKFSNPINDKLSFNLSFIDDYDSSPSRNTKKNDTRFVSALTYAF
ncbi:MAG TPA: DUF481 domain-containing protein [Candidatus Omnitrophica bacterium]|nr:DUF481 domain-containing protein [Candidatus Omnitrophota bacterium]